MTLIGPGEYVSMTNVPNLLGNQTNDTMFTAASSRRLTVVNRILNTPKPYMKRTSAGLETYRLASTKTQVTIGDVSKDVSEPKNPEYVPIKYLKAKESQHTLRHLRWMLQKDLLGQDMFLMGRPGPARRRLAMQFLQVTGRELEFVALSRDTTEADLKQRREIQNGSSKYFDQSAVRAAVEGRVLILEGVEKAERNVLPVLNNLLENREMHLEDGRFLIPASRYDKLL
ncbi:von Willebrand factor A domain-containing protein 8-like [Frankliniella occidentalis]|uniref:von Willebrand factor A domain-containing protein 8-like n=1 Tax=Frankliniella occidentalis TaxID=133901 RepID=A0A9C6WYW3_FRAOC|nr:von Willebrand factor A domain-containing protein 8-like [Frankliniella occidentalis]